MKTLIFYLALVVAASPSLSQTKGEMPLTTTSPEAKKLVRQAMADYADVKLDKGAALVKEALAKDPGFAMAYLLMYTTDIEMQKQNAAKAETLKMSADERLFLAGVMANQEKKPTFEFFSPLLTKYPKDADLHVMAAYNSDEKTGREIAEGLVKRNPKYAPGYNLVGYEYMAAKQMDKAEAAFNKYIELSPDEANPYDSKGDYFMATGNYKDAATQFEKAVSMGMTASALKARWAAVRMKNPDITQKDVEEIKKIIGSSMGAIKDGNIEGYLGFLDDQAIEIFGSQMSNIGAPNVRQRLTNMFKDGSVTKVEVTVKSVQGLGSLGIALGRIESTFKSNTDNEPTNLNRYAAWLLDRQSDGSWKIVAWINDQADQNEITDDLVNARKTFSIMNAAIKSGETLDEMNIEKFAAAYSSQAIEMYADGRSNVGLGNLKTRWSNYVGYKFQMNLIGAIGVEVAGRKAIAWGVAIQDYYPKDSQQINPVGFAWTSVLTKEKDNQWKILLFHLNDN